MGSGRRGGLSGVYLEPGGPEIDSGFFVARHFF